MPPPDSIARSYIAAFVKVFVLAAFLVAAVQTPVDAGRQDFTFVNYSGYTIRELYVSRSDHRGWEEDVLHSRVLPHGDYHKITFSSTENGKFWDIKAVLSNGTEWRWDGIDLLTYSKIVVDGSGTITKS